MLATTAAPGHDFCHFFYDGYFELGTQLSRVMARDLYGFTDPGNIDSPNVDRVFFSSAARDEVTLRMRDTDDTIVIEDGAEQDFKLGDGTAIISSQVIGPEIVLTLDGPSTANRISYESHALDGPTVTNVNGNGLLVFQQPIEPER